jgi:ABC-type transporter Mla subunit MlaD
MGLMRAAAFRTGVFVLAGIVLVLAVVFVLSGGALHSGQHYESYFAESVQGLDVGSPVKFRGVTIGKVTEIGLVAAEYPPVKRSTLRDTVYHQVVVRFRVSPNKLGPGIDKETLAQGISDGLRVKVAPQGITGIAYLELGFVAAAPPPQVVPWHPTSPVIPSVPSTLTEVSDAVQHLFTNLDKVKFGQMLNSLTSLVSTLNGELTTGDAHQTLRNANLLLAQLSREMHQADLPGTSAAVRNLAGGQQTQTILTQLAQASKQLAASSAAMPKLLAQTEATVAQASATTASLDRQIIPVLRNLNSASANMRELSETLKHDPAVILRGAAPPPQTPR